MDDDSGMMMVYLYCTMNDTEIPREQREGEKIAEIGRKVDDIIQ